MVLAGASQWLRSQRKLAFYGDVELAAAWEALALAEALIAGA
ncbi:MAG: hypothetical protein VKN56_07580 [Cyanobacteriota bacterium]|nr:hypothetical protein [Cyanobacteriota bacterium]